MRSLLLVASWTAALALPGCAEPQAAAPPSPLIVEGQVHAVSSKDIQAVLDVFNRRYRHSGSTPPSNIRVLVVDRNHIAIHYHTISVTDRAQEWASLVDHTGRARSICARSIWLMRLLAKGT